MTLRDEDMKAWAIVAATVRPLPGRGAPARQVHFDVQARASAAIRPAPAPRRRGPPEAIEPKRYRRMARGVEAIGARLDLHGLDQDRARAALVEFISDAFERGERGVLVITGKGALGDGVLRRRAPVWLAEPPLRPMVAGLSDAHRRHGGAGALYVALKRRPRAA